jgi:hypothetical protein
MSVKLARNVDANDIEFEGPMVNSYGGKSSKVKYGGRWLLLQTPTMFSPFGVNKWENMNQSGTTNASYSIDVSFNGYEDNEDGEPRDKKVREFHDKVREMEDVLIDHAKDNSYTWFDQENASREVAQTLLRSGIKFSKDKTTGRETKKYAPRLKFNLPVWEGRMSCKVFNDDGGEIKSIEEVESYASGKCKVVIIAKCDKVTFNGAKYGFKWVIQQMKITPSTNTLDSYAFIDEEGSSASTRSMIVADDDDIDVEDEDVSDDVDELDQESEEEDVAPPPKKVVKKRGRKKGSK